MTPWQVFRKQFAAARRRCHVPQAEVKTDPDIRISVFLSVGPEKPKLAGEGGVGSGEHAALAGGHVFRGVEDVADDVGG